MHFIILVHQNKITKVLLQHFLHIHWYTILLVCLLHYNHNFDLNPLINNAVSIDHYKNTFE